MMMTANRRIGSLVSQSFRPEPTGSGFRLFFFGWNPSDSAARANHYEKALY